MSIFPSDWLQMSKEHTSSALLVYSIIPCFWYLLAENEIIANEQTAKQILPSFIIKDLFQCKTFYF